MPHWRSILSSIIFYGGVIVAMCLLVHVGSTYGWAKVHDTFREMEPTLPRGHYKWINKRARRLDKIAYDDIIMFRRPRSRRADYTYEFGRVIGKPGDVVEMRHNRIYRGCRVEGGLEDKEVLTEHYVQAHQRAKDFSEFVVPRNTIFVMFDRRTGRYPLHTLLVPLRSIRGKVIR